MRILPIIALIAIAMSVVAAGPLTTSQVVMTAGEIKWKAAPAAFGKNVQFAVLAGDPREAGPFVARLKVPDGYKLAPHTHLQDQYLTVISGTLNLGLGDHAADDATILPAGGFALIPKSEAYYAWATGDTIVQINSVGPFDIKYVNPADDPTKTQ